MKIINYLQYFARLQWFNVELSSFVDTVSVMEI